MNQPRDTQEPSRALAGDKQAETAVGVGRNERQLVHHHYNVNHNSSRAPSAPDSRAGHPASARPVSPDDCPQQLDMLGIGSHAAGWQHPAKLLQPVADVKYVITALHCVTCNR